MPFLIFRPGASLLDPNHALLPGKRNHAGRAECDNVDVDMVAPMMTSLSTSSPLMTSTGTSTGPGVFGEQGPSESTDNNDDEMEWYFIVFFFFKFYGFTEPEHIQISRFFSPRVYSIGTQFSPFLLSDFISSIIMLKSWKSACFGDVIGKFLSENPIFITITISQTSTFPALWVLLLKLIFPPFFYIYFCYYYFNASF